MSSSQEEHQKALDKLCEKLQKKSKTVTNVRLGGVWPKKPRTHAAQLGPVLLNSSVVSDFEIDLSYVESADDVKPFLPFLRTNQHLRKLEVPQLFRHQDTRDVGDIFTTHVGLVLDAASENNGIEELYIGASEPFESILKCIQGTKPRVLTLTESFTVPFLGRIGVALKINPRLHSLTLNRADNVQFLLQHLMASSPPSRPPLESLSIGSRYWKDDRIDFNLSTLSIALAPLVAASTTLRQLKLYDFFSQATIEPLVKALEVNQSINELCLHGELGKVASKEMSTLLSSSDIKTNGIRQLGLRRRRLEGANVEVEEYMASLLGPSLQSLNLGDAETAQRLLAHSLKTGPIDRLPRHVRVGALRFADMGYLTFLLARVVGLREVTLSFHLRQGGRYSPMLLVLPALRQNWSLTQVVLVLENGEPYYKKETAETKKMQVYCTRNAVAPALLTGDPLPGETLGTTVDAPLRRRVVPAVYVLMTRHESQTTRNSIFKGVFAMKVEVEKDGRPAKRARLV